MCGIAGIFQRKAVDRPLESELNSMCAAIAHRGPDEFGSFFEKGVALGHQRLSIIDVASGQQPMVSEDERYVLIFNGEIYNYRELREALIALGISFRTPSDTEVILKGWIQWGPEVINKLDGMFAFAIWEKKTHSCFLVRDRLGIKPLYYSLNGGSLYFGSELKAITSVKTLHFEIRPQAVEDFFTFGYVPEPKTIYRQVFKLEPGHYLKVDQNSTTKTQYWDLQFEVDPQLVNNPVGAIGQFRDRFKKAVTSHLESEVPLGAFLSGGVDSSAIVATMATETQSAVNTCSIGFDVSSYDESDWADKISKRYNTVHNKKFVSVNDYELVKTLPQLYDEPFADVSALPTLRVCELAKEHVTVCLSGDGADELMGGYRRQRLHLNEERIRKRIPFGLRKPVFGSVGAIFPKLDWAPKVFRAKTSILSLSLDSVEAYYNSVSYLPSWLRKNLFSPEFKEKLEGYSSLTVFRDHAENYRGANDDLSLIQYLDMKTYLPGDILTKVDRASMAHSLEVRVPFLDHHFVEWLGSLPSNQKISCGIGKSILKKSMEPFLPYDLLYRKKMGFGVPIEKWFKEPLKETVVSRLTSKSFVELGIFDNEFIKKCLWQNEKGIADHSKLIWILLVFSYFIEHKADSV